MHNHLILMYLQTILSILFFLDFEYFILSGKFLIWMLSSSFPWERVWFDPRKTLKSTIVPFRDCKERVVFLETLKANVCIENKWLLTLLFRTGSSLCLPEDLKRKGNFPNWVLFPNHLYSQVLKLPWQSSLWKYEIRHVHKLWKPIRLSILTWTLSCITIKYHCSPVPLVPAFSDHKDILNCSLDLRAQ